MLPIKTIIFLKVTIVGDFYKVVCENENKLMNKITIKIENFIFPKRVSSHVRIL